MTKNVGSIDRVLRLILGVAIIALGVIYSSWWGLIGLIPLTTGAFSFCPLYPVLRICTIKGCSCKSETTKGENK